MEEMKNEFPDKWKDTIDPFSLHFKKIKITKILGYPYAANQVFVIEGIENSQKKNFILKYTGYEDSNIKNEVMNLSQLHMENIPRIVECDDGFTYRISNFLEGERLSTIVGDNEQLESLEYMYDFGKMLGIIHKQEGKFTDAPIRVFHSIPDYNYFKDLGLEEVYRYLIDNKPLSINRCFIHGDFHYANILWHKHNISAILDFELSGIGNKEFDIAWSLILRPEQKFMKSKEEYYEYIRGYKSENDCDEKLIKYYMILIYSRFIRFGSEEYKSYIQNFLKTKIKL